MRNGEYPVSSSHRIATRSERRKEKTKLLVIAGGRIEHREFSALPEYLDAGDWVVVNDAATLPASLQGRHARTSGEVEIRLAAATRDPKIWRAVVFGPGTWRSKTEERPAPPALAVGDLIEFGSSLRGRVRKIDQPRLIEIEFLTEHLWQEIYAVGKPVQYSYLEDELASWDQQTIFSGAPIAVEPPSASFPFTWDLVFQLKEKGVNVARVSHATGLSDTGDPALNGLLPLPELSLVPMETREALARAKRDGRRIVAVGTGVVRALETWAGTEGDAKTVFTELKISPDHDLTVATGLLTGMHEEGASHLGLVGAFVGKEILAKAYGEAKERGYLWHEYGDVCLIL